MSGTNNAESLLPLPGDRIVVVGTSGSGKTTLAGQLAALQGCPHIEMDAIHWQPNWTATPHDEFRVRLAAVLVGDSWVVDGNYGKGRSALWSQADTLVWLDYPLWLVLWRLFRRTVRRVVTQEELWSGNRENLRGVFSRDSIFLWAIQTHPRRRREYSDLPYRPEYAHLVKIRLRSPRQTNGWLARITAAQHVES
ncbi:MAG: adenylate kinase [Anaerolineaceae bacterium]|nr:adenylate kinase [Anaerolineaceae bacterium]